MNRKVAAKTRIERLGLKIPESQAPLANYLSARRWGSQIIVSGQLPLSKGELIATGRVGEGVSLEQAQECAKVCFLNALAAACTLVRLEDIVGVVRIGGYVAVASNFYDHAEVINGASNLAVEIFEDAGKHARAAVGVFNLPKNAPVEIEVIFGLKEIVEV